MSYCGKCGTPLENDKHICPACGADMRPANKIRQSDYGDLFVGLNPYAVSTEMRKDIAMVIKAMAIMAYIGPCVCVSLSMAKSVPYVRYHANQGLCLLIAETICYMASVLLLLNKSNMVRLCFIGGLTLVFVVLSAIGVFYAATGRAK